MVKNWKRYIWHIKCIKTFCVLNIRWIITVAVRWGLVGNGTAGHPWKSRSGGRWPVCSLCAGEAQSGWRSTSCGEWAVRQVTLSTPLPSSQLAPPSASLIFVVEIIKVLTSQHNNELGFIMKFCSLQIQDVTINFTNHLLIDIWWKLLQKQDKDLSLFGSTHTN